MFAKIQFCFGSVPFESHTIMLLHKSTYHNVFPKGIVMTFNVCVAAMSLNKRASRGAGFDRATKPARNKNAAQANLGGVIVQ